MENKRCEWLDALKGMLILFVILGHATDRKLFYIWVSYGCIFFSVGIYIQSYKTEL